MKRFVTSSSYLLPGSEEEQKDYARNLMAPAPGSYYATPLVYPQAYTIPPDPYQENMTIQAHPYPPYGPYQSGIDYNTIPHPYYTSAHQFHPNLMATHPYMAYVQDPNTQKNSSPSMSSNTDQSSRPSGRVDSGSSEDHTNSITASNGYAKAPLPSEYPLPQQMSYFSPHDIELMQMTPMYRLRFSKRIHGHILVWEDAHRQQFFDCECGQLLLTKDFENVKDHIKRHSRPSTNPQTKPTERRHQCKFCERSFERPMQLNGHMRTHSSKVKLKDDSQITN